MSEKKTFYAEVNGKQLECLRIGSRGGHGQGKRLGLVFLHEGLGCIEMWRDFPAQLCQRLDLDGFVFSRAGYGNSDACDLPRPTQFMHLEAKNVLPQILDVAGFDQVVLIGHSDGGSISLVHAGLEHSHRVQAVVTLAAHVFNEPISIAAIKAARGAYETGRMRQALKKYHGKIVDNCFYGWNDVWLSPDFVNWNIEEFLPAIKVPVLVIQGENDEYGTLGQVEAICAGVGGESQKTIVPDCGHSPHLSRQDTTLETIVQFIAAKLL